MLLSIDHIPAEKYQTSILTENEWLIQPKFSVEYFNANALNNSIKHFSVDNWIQDFSASTTPLIIEKDPVIGDSQLKEASTLVEEESFDFVFHQEIKKSLKMNLNFKSVKKHTPKPFI